MKEFEKELWKKLFVTFQEEDGDHLESIRAFLIKHEALSGREKKIKKEELDEVFRRAHSLKGAARAVDIQSVETLAHRLETLFARILEGKIFFESEVVRSIRLSLDRIED